MTHPKTYRGWNVHYDHPPIPIRSADWSATSPDYDVDCDQDGFFACAGQQVHAATYADLVSEIDAAISDSDPTEIMNTEEYLAHVGGAA
ncbi:hypothetical protein [Sphingopyxis sp.]|uniref:hypothetical protein n=1 Tax=Sphingopyxis sp. TaxID=1908224 RepID=UPI0025E89664|nr:hypothetical protein [Sphingopyxis sp.]MBK6414140.1 hypothetical protein [Sphingopyxis sp.]